MFTKFQRFVRCAVLVTGVTSFAVVAWACGSESDPAGAPTIAMSATATSAQDQVNAPALLRGSLTVDGEPFDADFLGARVLTNGLVTPCQRSIPAVFNGAYEIGVVAEAEVAGCGAPDAEIFLWTFIDDRFLNSLDVVRWPGDGREVNFDTTFSTSNPDGASPRTTDLAGEVILSDGNRLASVARVEAYVGDVLCAVASLRPGIGSDVVSFGFVLAVVEASSVSGCIEGEPITFRVDGKLVPETAVHNFEDTFIDLTLP